MCIRDSLMNPFYLVETLKSNGFEAKVLPVFWPESHSSLIRNLPQKILNRMMIMSKEPLYFSAFYAIYMRYNGLFPPLEHSQHRYKCLRSYLWPVSYTHLTLPTILRV